MYGRKSHCVLSKTSQKHTRTQTQTNKHKRAIAPTVLHANASYTNTTQPRNCHIYPHSYDGRIKYIHCHNVASTMDRAKSLKLHPPIDTPIERGQRQGQGKITQRPGSGRNRSETGTRETRLETGMETGQGGDRDKGTEPRARDSD